MILKKTVCLLLSCLLLTIASAQPSLSKDPDVVWAVEIEQDWVVDIPSLDSEYVQGIYTLKLLSADVAKGSWESPYLADMVFQAAMSRKLRVFKDPDCKIPADPFHVFPERDTLVEFDPETYEEKVHIWYHEPLPLAEFKFWRLRQILAYHKKSATWSTRVEAIAPMVARTGLNGETLYYYPLFWFKPQNKRPDISSDNIVWVKQTRNIQASTQVKADSLNPLKVASGFQSPIPHLLKVMRTDMQTPFYVKWKGDLIAPEARSRYVSCIETLNQKGKYAGNEAEANDAYHPSKIDQYRMVQTWYWDERRSRLSICLDAVGLIADILDAEGKSDYSWEILYRAAKE